LTHATSETERRGEIECGAFFFDVGGSEINCDALPVREFDAAIAEGRFDSLAAFFHGVIRQTDNVKVLPVRSADVDLGFDDIGVDT